MQFQKKNWFMFGLVGVAVLAVIDVSGLTINAGLWLKAHRGPDIIMQVSLFPEHGLALIVCVLHHITHLTMDAFLVQRLKEKG